MALSQTPRLMTYIGDAVSESGVQTYRDLCFLPKIWPVVSGSGR